MLRSRNKGVRRVRVADIEDNPLNFRDHGVAQTAALDGTIDELGWYGYPDVYETASGSLRLTDGHLRKELLLAKYGPDVEIEVNVTDFSDAEAGLALATKDPLAALASTNKAKLDELLALVEVENGSVQAMLNDLAAKAGCAYGRSQAADDVVPPLPEVPVTKPGDLWLLGEHRVFCGDATNPVHVARCLGGRKPWLMVTDPPYGVEYDPAWRKAAGVNNSPRMGAVLNDDQACWSAAWHLFEGAVAYVWHDGLHSPVAAQSLIEEGFTLRAQILWVKPKLVLSRGAYHWQHEPCFVVDRSCSVEDGSADKSCELAWYAVREGETAEWHGGRKATTVWEIGFSDEVTTVHSTQKPVECMARPMRHHGGPDRDVYDPFLGSFTTIIAGEQLGRRVYGLELSPAFCDVGVARWEAYTGQKAILQRGGDAS